MSGLPTTRSGCGQKLLGKRFRAADPDWGPDIDLGRRGILWGGEVAADRLTGYLNPAVYTQYLPEKSGKEALTYFAVEHRLRADPKENIEILNAFWTFPPDPVRLELVPPILVYADMMATLDPRNIEAAQLVREKYIDHALR